MARTFDPDSEEETAAEGRKPAANDDFTVAMRDRRSLHAIELAAAKKEELKIRPGENHPASTRNLDANSRKGKGNEKKFQFLVRPATSAQQEPKEGKGGPALGKAKSSSFGTFKAGSQGMNKEMKQPASANNEKGQAEPSAA